VSFFPSFDFLFLQPLEASFIEVRAGFVFSLTLGGEMQPASLLLLMERDEFLDMIVFSAHSVSLLLISALSFPFSPSSFLLDVTETSSR